MSDVQYIAIALQFWQGDATKALRLARLLAELEREFRADVGLVFCRRFDVDMSP